MNNSFPIKTYLVEAVGTFALAFALILSIGQGGFFVEPPYIAALVVALFVYTVAHVSGTHLNPAVTLGALAARLITPRTAAFYVIAQFAGASVAVLAASLGGYSLPSLSVVESVRVAVAEALGTALLTFGIASFVYGKVAREASGAVIGGSLLLGVIVAVLVGSAGLLNPAIAFAAGAFNFSYVIGALAGGTLGMLAYRWLCVAPNHSHHHEA
jgi:aquaporin Z